MLTPRQIRWASQHDWFIRDNLDGTINVHEHYRDANGDWLTRTLTWVSTFGNLKTWAGY